MKQLLCEHCGQPILILNEHRTYISHGFFIKEKPVPLSQGCCLGIIEQGHYKGQQAFLKPAVPIGAALTTQESPI